MTLSELLRPRSELLPSELLQSELLQSELLQSELLLWSLKAREADGEGALPVFVGFPAPEHDAEVSFS